MKVSPSNQNKGKLKGSFISSAFTFRSALIILVSISVICALPGPSIQAKKGVTVQEFGKKGVNIWINKGCGSVYRLGEPLEVHIRSKKSGYLTIFDLQPNGKVRIIFPNGYRQRNYIRAGREYRLPAPRDNFIFRIAPPVGRDDLLAVVTENKRRLVREDYSQFAKPFPVLRSSKGEVLKQVKKGVTTIPSSKWWAADHCSFCVGGPCKIKQKPEEKPQPGDTQPPETQQETSWEETQTSSQQQETEAGGERRALLVGISDYINEPLSLSGRKYNFNDLNFPVNDATEMKGVLKEDFDRVKLITNSQASYENIKEAIRGWLSEAGSDGLALFYFSGHGAFQTDSNGDENDMRDEVLVPYDYPRAERFIVDDEIRKWLSGLTTEHVIFIADSCHSGSAHKAVKTFYSSPSSKTIKPLRDSIGSDLVKRTYAKKAGKKDQRTLVALEASKPNQDAKENMNLKHGVFTNFLLEGLKGGADTDGNKKVYVSELFRFAHEEVYEFTDQKQEPVCEGCGEVQIYLKELR